MKPNQNNKPNLLERIIGITVGILLSISILSAFSLPFIGQTIFTLLFGWIEFIFQVIPYIFFAPSMIIEFIVIGLILIGGVHWFLSWFYKNYHNFQENERAIAPWKIKWTITGVSIFFLMFIISISTTGLIHEIRWLGQTPITGSDFGYGIATRKLLSEIGTGLEKYYQTNKHLPIVIQPVAFKTLNIPKEYYNGIIIDQWGMPILYNSNGQNYTLRSYGKNRILGGGTGNFDDLVYSDGQLLDRGGM